MATKTLYIDSRTKIAGTHSDFKISLPEELTLRGARLRVDNIRLTDTFKTISSRNKFAYFLDGLLQELTAIYPYETLVQMYEEAVNDQPYSFLFINLKKPKEEMFSVRFEEILQSSKEEDGSFSVSDTGQINGR